MHLVLGEVAAIQLSIKVQGRRSLVSWEGLVSRSWRLPGRPHATGGFLFIVFQRSSHQNTGAALVLAKESTNLP